MPNNLNFDQIYSQYYKRVFGYFLSKNLSYQDSEDLAHDVIIKVMSKLNTLKNEEFLSTWIYRISVNVCMDHFRLKTRSHKTLEDYKHILKETNIENAIENSNYLNVNMSDILNQILHKISYVLKLKYYELKSVKEIANLLSIAESSVKMRLLRGRLHIKALNEKTNNNIYTLLNEVI